MLWYFQVFSAVSASCIAINSRLGLRDTLIFCYIRYMLWFVETTLWFVDDFPKTCWSEILNFVAINTPNSDLDRCHTCDFIARFCRTSARLYRLSSCTLRLCRANKHGFCATFPVSRSCFTNTLPKWLNCSTSSLFWTLRLIVRFRFARQPTKIKNIVSVVLVSFVYATKSQCPTRQSATLSRDKVAHSCDILAR